jgi:hypothetical protein
MALAESIKSLWRGNFKDAANYLFVSQDEVDRGRMLDDKLSAINKADYERGLYSQDQYLKTIANLQANAFQPGGIFEQEGTAPAAGFVEGLKEGAVNMQQGVKNAVGGSINFGLGVIPWQVWVIATVYLAWRFGLIKFKR